MERSHLPTLRKCKSTKDEPSSSSSSKTDRSPKPDKSKKTTETKKQSGQQLSTVHINSVCRGSSDALAPPPPGDVTKKMAVVTADVTKTAGKQSNISRLVKLRPSALSLVNDDANDTKYYQDLRFDDVISADHKRKENKSGVTSGFSASAAFNSSAISGNEIDQTRNNLLLFQLRNRRQLLEGNSAALQYSPKLSSEYFEDVRHQLRGVTTSRSCSDRPCRSIMERVKSLDALDSCYDRAHQIEPDISPIYHELDPIDMNNQTTTTTAAAAVHHTYQSINEIREDLRKLRSESLSSSHEWGHSIDSLSASSSTYQICSPQPVAASQQQSSAAALTQDSPSKKCGNTKSNNSKLFFFSKLRLPKRNEPCKNTQVCAKPNAAVSAPSVTSFNTNACLIPPEDEFIFSKIKPAPHSKQNATGCSSVSPNVRKKFIFVDHGTSSPSSSSSILCSEHQTNKSPAAPHTPPQPSILRTFERVQTTRLAGAKTHVLSTTTTSSESIANKIDSVIDKHENYSAPATNLKDVCAHSSVVAEFTRPVCSSGTGADVNIGLMNNKDIGRTHITTTDRSKSLTNKKPVLDNKHVVTFKGPSLQNSPQRSGQQVNFATLPYVNKYSNVQSYDSQSMPSKQGDFETEQCNIFFPVHIDKQLISANSQFAISQEHLSSQSHSDNRSVSWKLKSVESLRSEEELSDYGSCERLNLPCPSRRIAFASPSCGIRMAEMRAIRRKSDSKSPSPEPIISTPPPSSFPRFFSYMQHGINCNALSENKKDASSQTHVKPVLRAVGICCQQKMHTIVEEDQGLSSDERLSTDHPSPTSPIVESENYANSELQSNIISDGNSTKSPSHPNGIHQVIQTSPSGHPEEFITCGAVTNDEEEKITVAPLAAVAPVVAAWSVSATPPPPPPPPATIIDLCRSNSDTDSPPPAIDIKSLRRTCNDLCTSRKVQKKLSDAVVPPHSVQANKTPGKNCTKSNQLMSTFEIRNLAKKSSTNLDYSEVIFDETITDASRPPTTNLGLTTNLGSTEFVNGVKSKGSSKLKPPRLVKCTGVAPPTPAPPQGKSIASSREAADAAPIPQNCPWKIALDQKRHSLPDVKSGTTGEIQGSRVASKQFCNASCNINDDSVTGPPKQEQEPMIVRRDSDEHIVPSPEIYSNAAATAATVAYDYENHKFDPSSRNSTKLEEPLLSNLSDTRAVSPPPPSPRTLAVAGKTQRYGSASSRSSNVFYSPSSSSSSAQVIAGNRCSFDQKQFHAKRMKSPRTSPHTVQLSMGGGGTSGTCRGGSEHCDGIDISRIPSSVNDYKNSSQYGNEPTSEVDGNCTQRPGKACSLSSNIPLPCGSACMTSSGDGGLSISSSSTGSSIVSMVSSVESESDYGAFGYKRRWPICEKSGDRTVAQGVKTNNLAVDRQKSATLQPSSSKCKLPKGKGAPQTVRSDKQFKVQATAHGTSVIEGAKECSEFQRGCGDRLTSSTQNLK